MIERYEKMTHYNRQNQRKILILGMLLMVCSCPKLGIGYSLVAREGMKWGLQESQTTPEATEAPQANTENVRQEPIEIPPEVLEMLLQQTNQDQGSTAVFRPLKASYRILLLGVAGLILFLGILICRYLIGLTSWYAQENAIFLFFGFMGALAALFIACGCIGSVYLHVASAACTTVSGFTIGAFLTPQFTITRYWVIGSRRKNGTPGDTND